MDLVERLSKMVEIKFNGTWNKLAKASDVKPQTLQSIKQGTEPKAYTISRISKALGVSVDWLLTGEDDFSDKTVVNINLKLLEQIINVVEIAFDGATRQIGAQKKAELITSLYDVFSEADSLPSKSKMLKLVQSVA